VQAIDRIETTLSVDRFEYLTNVRRAGSYRGRRSAFWPPIGNYAVSCTDLAAVTPPVGAAFLRGLAELEAAIDAEWRTAKETGPPARTRFADPTRVAGAMRALGSCLPREADRRAVELRTRAIERGYDPDILEELAGLDEEITVVAAQVATWYGKEPGGLPTAFACRRDEARQRVVAAALEDLDEVRRYLRGLHADLRLGDIPAFAATQLFFMAGEGNLHPKHIAYFLPEDEGVKHSPFKKTYYFGNTHQALLEKLSTPLAAQFLRVGRQLDPAEVRLGTVPALGVLGHELGHSVHRPATDFDPLHRAHRWASAVLQETAADVFGILIAAEVWAARLAIPPADAISYYLAECLRYADRGLGFFPDSDGMFLQLSYFVQLDALAVEHDGGPRLTGEPGTVLAALRSLARVLADALLAGRAEPAVELYRAFGPETLSPLRTLVEELRRSPFRSIEYVQEHIHADMTPSPDRGSS
jgi:hypothetical protein